MAQFTNQLINESSPYLLQHAHNPVNWMGWNDAAWQKAKKEDKLVIVSIGYSACHWCHVMEHESFEDETVAALMNEHFICIKVDREERPDVDQVYMDACQLITGRGGWPLNAVTLPDGRPVYAGTYFPKENWKQVLAWFVEYWKNKRDEAMERAANITNHIRVMDVIEENKAEQQLHPQLRPQLFEKFRATWDFEKGGRSGAPKFPMPVNLRYLLRNHYYTHNKIALQAAIVTLDNMLYGGIYDQVGGGFARYSVDDAWEIPHFEKMLYDNALLVSAYSEAYLVTGNQEYRRAVYETLAFIDRELSDTEGGFYSALDADSEGHEGKFYVWSYNDLKAILQDDFEPFCSVFNVSVEGNFEGAINLTRKPGASHPTIKKWLALLLQKRAERVRPGLDDKVLTSWNALMINGYCDAYRAFAEPAFLKRALQAAAFIEKHQLHSDHSVLRNYKNGHSSINGFLDDYGFTCEAFLNLYQVTLNEHWLRKAAWIAEYTIQHFYNFNTGLFFYTSVDDAPLIARKTETSDNVIPSSNSVMMKCLYQLGLILEKPEWLEMARKACLLLTKHISGYTSFYGNWAALADWIMEEPKQVTVCGKDAKSLVQQLLQNYRPDAFIFGAEGPSGLPLLQGKYQDGKTQAYVCQYKTCSLPLNTVNEIISQISH